MTAVASSKWSAAVADRIAAGFRYLDLLTAVDRIDDIEVIVHLFDVAGIERTELSTRVPADGARLPSLVPVLPAAQWHEREAAEMFGLEFVGHPDPRPLLLRADVDSPPLLKKTPLPERLQTQWPGAAPADESRRARRRVLPPGVAEIWTTAR
jgi:NADH-quinone oxidoreductase subunit C